MRTSLVLFLSFLLIGVCVFGPDVVSADEGIQYKKPYKLKVYNPRAYYQGRPWGEREWDHDEPISDQNKFYESRQNKKKKAEKRKSYLKSYSLTNNY